MSFHVSLVGCGSPHREDGRRHVTRTSPRKLLITQRSVLRVDAAAWIRDATTVRGDQPHLRPGIATGFFGYGYQTWIFPGERPMFALLGVRGQSIFVDPTSRLVMVHTAVRRQPANDPGNVEAGALWAGIVRTLGQ